MKIIAARVFLAGRNPGKAKEILTSLGNLPDLPPTYWLSLGQVQISENRPAAAEAAFKKGLSIFPGESRLLLALVDTQVFRKKYGEARKNLDRLIKSGPDNPLYVSRMGTLAGLTKGLQARNETFRKAARKYPDSEALETLYLVSLSTSKELPKAIAEGRKYLATHGDKQAVRLLLGDFELQSGHREKAIGLYREVLSSQPTNLQALSDLGYQEFLLKHFAEAESLYRRALRGSPGNANLETGLGEALLAENQHGPAMEAFRKALEDNPNQILALLELGRSEVLSGDSRGGLRHLAPLVKVPFPQNQAAQVQWLWGIANQGAGNQNVAQDALVKAVRLDPGNPSYHETLGEYWISRSRWDLAVGEFKKSRSLDPHNELLALQTDWAQIRENNGKQNTLLLEKVAREAKEYVKSHPEVLAAKSIEASTDLLLKKPDEAIGVYDAMLSAHPGDPRALLGKAAILLGKGKANEATPLVAKVLANDPNNFSGNLLMAKIDQSTNNLRGEADHLEKVHQLDLSLTSPALSLARVDLALGRNEEAKSVAFALFESHPDLFQALFLRAQAEMALGEFKHAEIDFQTLSRHDKNPGPMLNLASVAAGKMGDGRASKKLLEEAFRSAPKDPGILNNMAYSLAAHNENLPQALQYAKTALGIAPAPFIQDTLGYVLFRMGRYDQAESHFHKAFEANFRDPEFLLHMGLNEWKLGKKDHAESLLRKAVTSGGLTSGEQEEAQRTLRKLSGA